jgi:hypothetical protein
MTFAIKNWHNAPSTATPLSAEALEDLESRLADYIDLGDTLPAYTVQNANTLRSFDADSVTLDELADIVATLIADLT